MNYFKGLRSVGGIERGTSLGLFGTEEWHGMTGFAFGGSLWHLNGLQEGQCGGYSNNLVKIIQAR